MYSTFPFGLPENKPGNPVEWYGTTYSGTQLSEYGIGGIIRHSFLTTRSISWLEHIYGLVSVLE